MSYDEYDYAMDMFYERMSEELYPEHKEHAIDEFVQETMVSYYLRNPTIINAPFECYHHANSLMNTSKRCAHIMYTTSIELFLKSVLLKPVLYGMIHNENVAQLIVDSSTGQAGFNRYKKLLSTLCMNAAEIDLNSIVGMNNKPILQEVDEVQSVRNKIVHQGYDPTIDEFGTAKNIATLILGVVVEPVLNNMNLIISGDDEGGFTVAKA